MDRILASIMACLGLLLAACSPTARYEDPLTQLGRGTASPAASTYKNLRLGVVYDDNTKQALKMIGDDRVLRAVILSPASYGDEDPTFLTKSIDDILLQRFKDVQVLERYDAQHKPPTVDAVMVLDVQIQIAAHVGDTTSVTLQGTFVDDAQNPIAEIKGDGADKIPLLAGTLRFKPAAAQALQRFALALDGSTDLASKLPMSAAVAIEPEIAAAPIAVPASLGTVDGRRIALVIGNSSYRNVPRLANPAKDARLIAATLNKVGFELIGGGALLDLDHNGFIKALTEFGNRLQGSSVGVFYYAGHGLQMQGANFLVPVEANPTKPSDADIQLVNAALVLRQMDDSGASLKVVILDACRNNPFGGRGLRDASGGLAQMRAPEGTVISYATQPGNVALDGDSGGDSPYSLALARSIVTPGLDVLAMFNEVGVQVDSSTNGVQQPWFASSPIKGKFYFTAQ